MNRTRAFGLCAATAAIAALLWPRPAAAQTCAANALARRTIAHELEASRAASPYLYRETKQTSHGLLMHDVITTAEFRIERLIGRDGRRLSGAEQASEDARIERLLVEGRKRRRLRDGQRETRDRMRQFLQAAPDAFLFQCRGRVTLSSGEHLIRLAFRPNPSYQPGTRALEVLTGMSGTMLLDPVAWRVVRLEATLMRDVDFGWGVLGKLYRGGHVLLQQRPIGHASWAMTRLELHFDGRVMLVKGFHLDSLVTRADYRPLSADLTLRSGVALLLQHDDLAQNGSASPPR